MRAWRIGVDTPDFEADDLIGIGAERTGGRWNTPGHRLVYTAESRALAALETRVHIATKGLPMNRYLVAINIPDAIWSRRTSWAVTALPVGWDAAPHGAVSLRLGDQWLQGATSAVLQVPSVVVPEEHCILINPMHPKASAITAIKVRRWLYDPRMGQRTQ